VLERIIEAVSDLSPLGLGLAAGLLAFAETGIGLDLIIPGEAGMVVAGSAADEGSHPVWLVIIGAAIGATLGDCMSYAIGRRFGMRLLRRWGFTRRHLLPAARRAEPWFQRHGGIAIFLGRWVGALRAIVPLVAGTTRMPFKTFLAWNVAASIAWATVAVGLGYRFGVPAARAVDRGGVWIYALGALALVAVIAIRRARATAAA
jgi:membrane-associated protein